MSAGSRTAWHRLLLAGKPRLTKANVLATALALLLGFAIAVQVRQNSLQGLDALREDELARILDTLDKDGQRLADEARRLQTSKDLLTSSSTRTEEATRAAQQRLDALAVLTGTVAARGPGITLRIADPERKVTAAALLDAVQELRDAGAEAIQLGEVRVVADTWFADADGGVSVSGTVTPPPYVIKAIGDQHTLSTAMGIPEGVLSRIRSVGANADLTEESNLVVDALHRLSPAQYAQPVPNASTSQGAP